MNVSSSTCLRLSAMVALICLSVSSVYAQQTAGFFQTVVTSPRSQALGEATVALRGYPGAAQINPAAIGRPKSVQLSSTLDAASGLMLRTPWLPGSGLFDTYWIASPSLDVSAGRWAFAYQYKEFNFYSTDLRTDAGDIVGTVRDYDNAHKLAGAYDLTPDLRVGAGVNLIHIRHFPGITLPGLEFYEPRRVSVDLGVQYQRDFETRGIQIRPSVGWSLTDFGKRVRYTEQHLGDPLATIMRGGASVELATGRFLNQRPLITLGLHGALSKDMVQWDRVEDGQVSFEPHGPFRALFTTWRTAEITLETDRVIEVGVWDRTRRHGGVEVSLAQILYGRLGRYYEPLFIGGRTYSTWGWGVDLYFLTLDHSRVISDHWSHQDMSYWTLTARVPLGYAPENFWPELLKRLH